MVQYIDKDALIAEIENWKQHTLKCGYVGQGEYEEGNKQGRLDTCEKILYFIDTLEVKEVDLEKRTKILADIIFDAAKHGYMPYDTQDEHCAMEKARRNIIKLI